MDVIKFFFPSKAEINSQYDFNGWLKHISSKNTVSSRLEAISPFCQFLAQVDSQDLCHDAMWLCWNSIEDLFFSSDRDNQRAVFACMFQK